MSFLRDPIWTFIGVIVAVLALGAAIGIPIWLWLRNRKALSYEVVSNVPVVTVQHGSNNVVTEDIEIRYKGEPVHDVRFVVVRVWNSGNQPIVPSDHIKPITLTFWGKMLASDVVETSPPSLKPDVIAGGGVGPGFQAIAFQNLLLNPKDSVTIQALMTDFTGKVEVDIRIVGISAARQASRRWTRTGWSVSFAGSVVLGGALAALLIALAQSNWMVSSAGLILIAAVLAVAGGGLTILQLLWQELKRRE